MQPGLPSQGHRPLLIPARRVPPLYVSDTMESSSVVSKTTEEDRCMRKSLCVLMLFAVVAVAPAALGEDCSCTAPDGSCNASISCSAGCIAICGSGGKCSASCSGGGGGGWTPEQPGALRATGEQQAAPGDRNPLSERVSLDVINISAEEVSALISNLAGREITFVPNVVDERFTIRSKNFTVGELISALAEHGAIGSLPRRAAFAEVRLNDPITVEAKGVTGATLAEMVAALTGGRVVLVPSDPESLLNLQVKNLRLGQLLEQLALFGEVTVDGRRVGRHD